MRMGGAPPGAGPQGEVSELGLRAPSAPAPGAQVFRGYSTTVLIAPFPFL